MYAFALSLKLKYFFKINFAFKGLQSITIQMLLEIVQIYCDMIYVIILIK